MTMPTSTQPDKAKQTVIIVTGMNGAGKSTALKIFEDMGYEAVDNLPLSLLLRLLRTGIGQPGLEENRPIALCVDSRTRAFKAHDFMAQVRDLSSRSDIDISVLFFDCSDETLTRRYSETRRRHPHAADRPVLDGIHREREIMEPVKSGADFVYDTTGQTVHDLKRRLMTRYAFAESSGLAITVMSFGFSRGVPRDADLVFDVRFLRNPNYDPNLKSETGQREDVAAYIASDPNFSPFFSRLSDMVTFLLPLYQAEGKSYVTIACGCTGGRHRSVFTVEMLGRVLEEQGWRANIAHRDLAPGDIAVKKSDETDKNKERTVP